MRAEEGGPRRQLLHAARLAFTDPSTGGPVAIASPTPEDFDLELDTSALAQTGTIMMLDRVGR